MGGCLPYDCVIVDKTGGRQSLCRQSCLPGYVHAGNVLFQDNRSVNGKSAAVEHADSRDGWTGHGGPDSARRAPGGRTLR